MAADIEMRVQSLAINQPAEEESDTFADRAEGYYQKRPQLLSLLQDLHHRYLYLADRYSQSLLRQISAVHSSIDDDDDRRTDLDVSDAESSLSFQIPPDPNSTGCALDLIAAELVSAAVERELLLHELAEADRHRSESDRKIGLQRSLVEVLESERMVLLGENARLGYRAAAAEEEGRGMARELGFMRRRAAEMGRLVVKLREDHRVCILGRKIEGLQAHICGLERRNREFCEAMKRREVEEGEVRVELNRLREENRRLREEVGWRGKRLWDRVKRMEWAPCGPQVKGKEMSGCFYL